MLFVSARRDGSALPADVLDVDLVGQPRELRLLRRRTRLSFGRSVLHRRRSRFTAGGWSPLGGAVRVDRRS
jgi:hypothetical protein